MNTDAAFVRFAHSTCAGCGWRLPWADAALTQFLQQDGKTVNESKRITHDPAVMGGKPCIRGMRVTVGTIVGLLASGKTYEEILGAYPYLEREDIQASRLG